MLSERIQKLAVSPNRKFNPYAAAAEARGTKILSLNIGQPDIDAPDLYFEAMGKYPKKHLPYANSKGITEMIDAQVDYYEKKDLHFSPDEIFVTVGAMEGIMFSLLTLCDVGDAVVLAEPFYTNYKLVTDLYGLDIQVVKTSIDNNYQIPSLEELESIITDKSKAILLANPGNPTGRVYTKDEMDRLVKVAKDHSLVIIADEVYREFNYTDRPFVSFASYADMDQQVILLDSASKKYAACGSRIGTLATKNKDIAASILKLCQMRLSAPTLEQFAVSSLHELDQSYFDDVAVKYDHRRRKLQAALEEIKDVQFSIPEGAFYTLVSLPMENAEDFVIWLLNDFEDNGETILPSPAEAFYATEGAGRNEIRISYCVSEDVLIRAVEILDKALDQYPKSFRNKKD